MDRSRFIEKLSTLKKVFSVTGKEYGNIVVKGDKLLFIRGHKSNYERIPVSELFALYDHGPHINNAIAKNYISGRVQSPAVSIVNAIRGGTSVSNVLKELGRSEIIATDKSSDNFDLSQLEKLDFRSSSSLDKLVLSKTGFYFIQLKSSSTLPIRYRTRFEEQGHRIIYIGKAEGQSLSDRLDQELLHTSPGTFFRSVGAMLQKEPIPEHLKGKSNQNNYKFSKSVTQEIIDWLKDNVEVGLVNHKGDFRIEKKIIERYSPILNIQYNPNPCIQLKSDRDNCRRIARRE